jgi:hypothetical protein
VDEVVAREKELFARRISQGVAEAVTDIEPRGVPGALSVIAICITSYAGLHFGEWLDLELDLAQSLVQPSRQSRIVIPIDDIGAFDEGSRGHGASRCQQHELTELISFGFALQNGQQR